MRAKMQSVIFIDAVTAVPERPDEINGCPFCHGHTVEIRCRRLLGWQVICMKCDATAPNGFEFAEEALLAWNFGATYRERTFILSPEKLKNDLFETIEKTKH